MSGPRAGEGRGRTFRGRVLACTALAFVLATSYLGSHFIPSTEAVRVRNAFLLAEDLPSDFDWRPPAVPEGFMQQGTAAPALFRDAAAAVGGAESPLGRMAAMVNRLNPGRRLGDPIQESTVEAYRIINATGTGYCSDYTQVLNGLAWAAGIPVREWGVSFDGFGGSGHAFNEVFDAALGKWIMIDPFNAFWVRDVATGAPLSAIEFRDRLRLPEPLATMELVRLRPPPAGYRDAGKMITYYQQGVDQFYLWWGNNVFDYDGQRLVRAATTVSRGLEQLAAIAVGVHPRIRILPTPGNAGMVSDLKRTRTRVVVLFGICAVLLGALIAEWALWRRAAREAG